MLHLYKSISSTEIYCFNIDFGTYARLDDTEQQIILDLLDINDSNRVTDVNYEQFVEYGPHPSMATAWCTNVLNIFTKCGINKINRIEQSFLIKKDVFDETQVDNMLQRVYDKPLDTFVENKTIENPYYVTDIRKENIDKALGFDEDDIKFYEKNLKNPTNIELYDLAQSNSEHSRHWFFNGQYLLDDKLVDKSLFQTIKETQPATTNSLIAFRDNSSSIVGHKIDTIIPNENSIYTKVQVNYNPVFTAETHNFPTGIAPYPGAATGTGGRIRDNQSVGRGGLIIAGTAGYCVGDIRKDNSRYYEKNLKTLVEASNGASGYGNMIGEPVIQGFCRTYGSTHYYREQREHENREDNEHDDNEQREHEQERIEWVKPIMFTGGIGQMNHIHTEKIPPKEGFLIVRLGGPAYRIGIGGGAASSKDQTAQKSQADYNAVQRGDPEMGNKLNRVIRRCIEMGEYNPILSIHDQGAGGMANVTKEIVYPNGGHVDIRKVILGDYTLSVLEIWVSEHQEQDTVLIDKTQVDILSKICNRELLPMVVVGEVTNTGIIKVFDSMNKDMPYPVDLNLKDVLGGLPKKLYKLEKIAKITDPFVVPSDLRFIVILDKVLQLPSVGSKRFLTYKVDRSVTGLIAQQQCVGPLHTPLSNVSIVAQSHQSLTGSAIAIGEQPLKSILNPKAMARLAIGEMLTNMMWAKISKFENIKCSGNWMWAMKLPGEQYNLYAAGISMCQTMLELGIALDGGKDSLSMSYREKDGNIIKCPGSLVISGYVDVLDIRKKITPDLKHAGNHLYFIDLAKGKTRIGASALTQAFNSIGSTDQCPDMVDSHTLKSVFNLIQELIDENLIISGHDRSDGGLVTTILEMAFAGNLGCQINITSSSNHIEYLFAEELGIVIEVKEENCDVVESKFKNINDITDHIHKIGHVTNDNQVIIKFNEMIVLDERVTRLRSSWETPSYNIELLQSNLECVEKEYKMYKDSSYFGVKPLYRLNNYVNNFISNPDNFNNYTPIKVAIIREEGSNGDREMASVLDLVGFEVHDICMNDIYNGKKLDEYNGIVFVGGFSYADVLGSAKGWAKSITSIPHIAAEFNKFYNRTDTFSLGICNGCQLMAHLGWIPECQLLKNKSGKFESRYSTVKINKSPSIMLKGMEESTMGIWIAHGEGQFYLKDQSDVVEIPIQYVDFNGKETMDYPHNPNGSMQSIAGLCSTDGRHLGMMPHPERCYLQWQCPYDNNNDESKSTYTGWLMMFINAYKWVQTLKS